MPESQSAVRARGVLPPCRCCGIADPNRMHALMSFWFGSFVDLPVDNGYFYLCPACYDSRIAPRLDEIFRRSPERAARNAAELSPRTP